MIVSDSTTLIILFDLDKLDLLSNVFAKIIIPKAVYDEISCKTPITLPDFITVKTPQKSEILETLKSVLDMGESEAIALALQMKTGLIIDEKKGRKIAISQGLEIIGLLGILYLNITKGFLSIKQAETFLKSAIDHGYRINQTLVDSMFERLV